MGSYGIEPARIMAAAIEQYADDQSISWPRAIAPFDVAGLGSARRARRRARSRMRCRLLAAGLDTLYDDRASSAGEGSPTPSCSAARCG